MRISPALICLCFVGVLADEPDYPRDVSQWQEAELPSESDWAERKIYE